MLNYLWRSLFVRQKNDEAKQSYQNELANKLARICKQKQ